MQPADYASIRLEIIVNHVLMHAFSLVAVLLLLAGAAYVERRSSILSVWLPLLTLSWAAMIVRFDFFIHRQGAYLRALQGAADHQRWESWKASLTMTPIVVPLLDVLMVAVIVVVTCYLLFGPARAYFVASGWPGGTAYAWTVAGLVIALLLLLPWIPRLASLRRD